MNNTRLLTSILAVGFTLVMAPRVASAYCTYSPHTAATLPVRLHADLHSEMRHSDGTNWTRIELERAMQIVITRLNDSAGADAPHVYLDLDTPHPTCAWETAACPVGNPRVPEPMDTCGVNNAIVIYPDNCGLTWWSKSGSRHVIAVEATDTGLSSNPKYWDHVAGAGEAFEITMLHELGHALGLAHPQGCNWSTVCPAGSSPCAVMAGDHGNTRAHEYFMPDDRAGLRALYGSRPAPIERQFESNNLSNGMTEWPLGNVDAQGFFAASTYAGLSPTSVTLVGYRRDVAGSPVVYSWDWSTFSLTSVGTPWYHSASGPLGAAQSSTARFVTSSTHRMTPDARRWSRRITTSNRPLNGSMGWTLTQSNPSQGSVGDTVAAGIGVAHDPQQNAVLYAFRDSWGKILLQAGTGGVPFATNIQSEGAPSIACAPGAGLNCIVVSVEPGRPITTSTAPRLRWFRFSRNPSTGFVLGPLHTTSYVMHAGDPQASVYWNGSSWEYVVVYRQPFHLETYVHALRMASGASAFSFWGTVAHTSSLGYFTATGSTRDLEVFTFRQ